MNRFFYTLLLFCVNIQILFAQPELIFDDFRGSPSIGFIRQVNFNGQYVFQLQDINKRDIWMTDGTNTNNLTIWLSENSFFYPTVTDNYVYFIEDLGNPSIWRNDGTYTGSEKVWENPALGFIHGFQDKLFAFTYTRQDSLPAVWIINEDETKTKLLDSTEGTWSTAIFNNHLYFYASNHGLVKSDGTIAGTSVVKPVGFTTLGGIRFENATVFNNELYFQVSGNSSNAEIWKTDGTEAGTVFVGDFYSNEQYPYFKFVATSSELFIYDKERIYCINNQGFNLILDDEWEDITIEIYNAKVVNDKAIFAINTFGKYGTELWTSDGTIEGTTILKDIYKYAADGVSNSQFCFEVIGNYLYFIGNSGQYGQEIWRTDGTVDGTHLVYDLKQNAAASFFENMFAVGNSLYLFRRELRSNLTETRSIWKFEVNNFTPPQYEFNNESNLHSIYAGENSFLFDFEQDNDKSSYLVFSDDSRIERNLIFFNQDTTVTLDENFDNDTPTITKLSADNEFEWTTTVYSNLGLSSNHRRNLIIDVSDNNKLYASGIYNQSLRINDENYPVNNGFGFYVNKLNDYGQIEWLFTGSFDNGFSLQEILVNSKEEVFVIGIFDDMSFKGNALSGNKGIFVLKLDKNGKFISLKKIGKLVNSVHAALSPDDAIILTEVRDETIFLHKINRQNNILWTKQFDNNENVFINNVAVSPMNEIYLLGNYHGLLNFNRDTAHFKIEQFQDITNGFIAKFNNFGELISLSADETTNSNYRTISFDKLNNEYYLIKTVRFTIPIFQENWEDYPITGQTIIQKYDANGQLINERKLSRVGIQNIAIGDNNTIKCIGTYYNQLDTFTNCIPSSDIIKSVIFLLDLPIDNTFDSFEPTYVETDITISPNPANTTTLVYIHDEAWQSYQLNIYSSTGQLVKSISKTDESNAQSVRVADLPTGLLIFEFNNGNQKLTKKVVKY